MRGLVLCCCLWLPGPQDPGVDPVRAFRDGQHGAAAAAFVAAARTAGEREKPVMFHNAALAALLAEDIQAADAAAVQVERLDPLLGAGLRPFVRGFGAYRAALEAARTRAFDPAVAAAEVARRAFEDAAASRMDWPEARRNAERAARLVARLKELQAAAADERNKSAPKPPPPAPEEPPDPGERPAEEKRPAPGAGGDLAPEDVARILQRLAEKQQEKLRLRRVQQQVVGATVERDW